ncbi:hypothetical protein [Inquilinus limosus]|uniref:hypothetical protein n=1 Tax=Inquilinus limosus TaxID=171674 RepID=UPI0004135C9C|nr:hypothetical protein [Inquilinus limosus]
MQSWRVDNPAGDPVEIQGEDLVSALSRHREALLAVAFPNGIETVDRAWMRWNEELFDGEGGVEITVTGRSGGGERQGLLAVHAAPGEIAPDTGRSVFF